MIFRRFGCRPDAFLPVLIIYFQGFDRVTQMRMLRRVTGRQSATKHTL
jgi:hypothetical protein